MLETLRIRNIAVIDEAEIPFKKGLNILSGETGAGKSIVIEAISLLLGGRASAELIRSGCEEAVIEGLFLVRDIPWIAPRLERFGLSPESDSLLIRRIVNRSGRHRIYINGEMATLGVLQELTEGLVDLCGQHEHQSLLKSQTQIELLDRYGGLENQARKVAEIYSGARSIRSELERIQSSETETTKRSDFLKFQIEELKAARLAPGEDVALQDEKKRLQSVDQRLQLVRASQASLSGDSDESQGALDLIRQVQKRIENLKELDPSVSSLAACMQRGLAEVEDVSLSLERYLSSCEIDPGRLEQIQERLAQIADLRRKYGSTVEEMLATLNRLESEWSIYESSGERAKALQEQLQATEKELRQVGERLSAARKKIAKVLSDSVTGELRELRMEDAKFSVQLETQADLSRWSAVFGADEVQFVVQTNRGEPARPLSKIASGGELSRLMLAIRRVISDRGGIGVYLFDEIDAGIGGQTAVEVGKKLKSVAQHNQVICITHLPQVAAFADQHLLVQKKTKGNRTLTEVVELGSVDRKKELARMMGGPQMSKILK